MIDAKGTPNGEAHPGPLEHDDIMTEMMFRSALTHPALMFRREAILRAGNYARPKPVEDLDLYMRMAGLCEFRNLDEEVLDYRLHDNSICRVHAKEQQQLVVDVVASYSRKNYGISSKSYRRLGLKKSGCAIVPLLRSARFRAGGNKMRFLRIVSSRSFIYIGRCVTGPRDYVSKVAFRLLEKLS